MMHVLKKLKKWQDLNNLSILATNTYPGHTEWQNKCDISFWFLNKYQLAIKHYKKAIELKPTTYHTKCIKVFKKLKQWNEVKY